MSPPAKADENRQHSNSKPDKPASANSDAKQAVYPPAAALKPPSKADGTSKPAEPKPDDYGSASPIWTNWIQAVSAALVMLMTFFLWRLSAKQTRILEANARETSDAVKIAKESANAATSAARLSEKAFKLTQRPYVRTHQFVFDTSTGSGEIVVINEGNTAGQVIGSEVFSYYGKGLPQEHLVRKHDRENALENERRIRAGEVFGWPFQSEKADDIQRARISDASDAFTAFIIGRIAYVDELGTEHHMLFCRKFDKVTGRYLDIGDPDYSRDG